MNEIKDKKFLEKSPFGKIPVLETEHGFISDSSAIIRYLSHIVSVCTVCAHSNFENGIVDQWIAFSHNELEPAFIAIMLPILGNMEFNEATKKKALKDVHYLLKILDN